jgi:hypothetical protein
LSIGKKKSGSGSPRVDTYGQSFTLLKVFMVMAAPGAAAAAAAASRTEVRIGLGCGRSVTNY